MRYSPTFFIAVLLLLFLGSIHAAQGDDKPTSKDLGKIQPPGGRRASFEFCKVEGHGALFHIHFTC
jgi:hypothetical protein